MSESKTARASAVKVSKEVRVETTEEAIHALRVNREAGLHIGDMSRVDKLLAEYDAVRQLLVASRAGLQSAIGELEYIKTGSSAVPA